MKAFPLVVLLLPLMIRRSLEMMEVVEPKFFGKAFEGNENPEYTEEGTAVNMPCIAAGTILSASLTKNPTVTWVEPHEGKKIANIRMTVLPEGELQVSNVNIEDSGVYQCNMVTEGDVEKISYKHTLIVYTFPAFRRTVEYVYISKVCDDVLISRLLKEVNAIVCSDTKLVCGFQVHMLPCEKHRSDVYVKMQIIIHAASIFKAPKCGPTCVKEAYARNLDRDEIRAKLDLLQKSSQDIFPDITGFKFDPTRTVVNDTAVCPDGYVVFKDVLCIPCMHGYYKSKDNNQTCHQCGVWAYQPKFGSSSCIRCPQMGQSDYVTSPSIKLCKSFWSSWMGITSITLVVVVSLVGSFLILLHLGFFPFLYKTEGFKKKEAKKKAEEETEGVENLMEHFDATQGEGEEQGGEEAETLLDRTTAAGADKNKKWYPGLGWM